MELACLYAYVVTSNVQHAKLPYSSHHIVVVIGYVETLVEVDERDGQATLTVSISFPEPDPYLGFEIMFRLDATMTNITAGISVMLLNFFNHFHNYFDTLLYVQDQDLLQLAALILLHLGYMTIRRLPLETSCHVILRITDARKPSVW